MMLPMLQASTTALHSTQPLRHIPAAHVNPASRVVMSTVADEPVKKRGLPPGEAAPDGTVSKPVVVGRVPALDFLKLGDDEDKSFLGYNFAYYREAEIKHGRIAMLAAVAWPLQEVINPFITQAFGMKDLLEASNGASPSLLNGGLFQLEVLPAVLLFFYGASTLERSDLETRAQLDLKWNEFANGFGFFGRTPGDFRFDPLNFYKPLSFADKVAVQERELLNGRVAMLAVASYVTTEVLTGQPVVLATPALFEPIIFNDGFRAMMDASFGGS